eukprot:gene18652-22220_t
MQCRPVSQPIASLKRKLVVNAGQSVTFLLDTKFSALIR